MAVCVVSDRDLSRSVSHGAGTLPFLDAPTLAPCPTPGGESDAAAGDGALISLIPSRSQMETGRPPPPGAGPGPPGPPVDWHPPCAWPRLASALAVGTQRHVFRGPPSPSRRGPRQCAPTGARRPGPGRSAAGSALRSRTLVWRTGAASLHTRSHCGRSGTVAQWQARRAK